MYLADGLGQSFNYDEIVKRAQEVSSPASSAAAVTVTSIARPFGAMGLSTLLMVGLGAFALYWVTLGRN